MPVETIRVKAWKQASARKLFIFVGDICPVLAGLLLWYHTTSVLQGIVWGCMAWVLCSYVLIPLITELYLVGFTEKELTDAVSYFAKNARTKDYLDMALGTRRLRLYCEVTMYGEEYIGFILPRKYWHGVFDDQLRQRLEDVASLELIERSNNIYARAPKSTENGLAILDVLMKETGVALRDVASRPYSSLLVHVLSDHPPMSPERKGEVSKK